ncbi:hypothetical protein M0802_010352 [Mischocyttarus mexicanus]|nr:hypothetical protein M0802_010352 [Mischocyttarus mexicanus]
MRKSKAYGEVNVATIGPNESHRDAYIVFLGVLCASSYRAFLMTQDCLDRNEDDEDDEDDYDDDNNNDDRDVDFAFTRMGRILNQHPVLLFVCACLP